MYPVHISKNEIQSFVMDAHSLPTPYIIYFSVPTNRTYLLPLDIYLTE